MDILKVGQLLHIDAAKAYIEAARFAFIHKLELFLVIAGYEQSAKMILKINPKLAFKCFQKQGSKYRAIEKCFRFGHEIEIQTGNIKKSEQFYDQGDKFRKKYNINHRCGIYQFKPDDYTNNIKYAYYNMQLSEWIQMLHIDVINFLTTALCRECIKPYYELRDYYVFMRRKYTFETIRESPAIKELEVFKPAPVHYSTDFTSTAIATVSTYGREIRQIDTLLHAYRVVMGLHSLNIHAHPQPTRASLPNRHS
ncbi:hypothetical protein RF11_13582 [Thelohanellus kitauei]|uniref:Uncharacterized protein n=1 Tax=Thelohanellus kitauei TaxID=669202 RepID=A0A0C2JUG9_THEKT|nr:hypothetical protein RF11_13582 [Thelohanellus kitauei]